MSCRCTAAAALIRWLLDNQLVDEIILLTYPVVVGQGTRLFPDTGPDTALELVETRDTSNGVTIQVYGRPDVRNMQPPPPTETVSESPRKR